VIERGGGVTVEAAIAIGQSSCTLRSNAMTLSANSSGRADWLIPLLATRRLDSAWGICDGNGAVPLYVFLSHILWRHHINSQTEWVALQMLDRTPIECLKIDDGKMTKSCLKMAIAANLVHLVVELIRRQVSDVDDLPNYVNIPEFDEKEKAKWMEIYAANRSYFDDVVPTLHSAFENIFAPPHTKTAWLTMPKPLIALIVQFVRGPLQLQSHPIISSGSLRSQSEGDDLGGAPGTPATK
jgi:hypothetical protein